MTATAAAIGTFDGVHTGHAAVLQTLREVAAERDLTPVAITFDRHPLSLIAPQRAPLAITTLRKKEELLENAGVKPIILPFDEKLRRTTAKDWMQMIHDDLGVEALVVGYDNTFGSDGVSLSLSDYRRIGEEVGIDVTEAPYVPDVSSSAVRKNIKAGNVEQAWEMLGRRFVLPGLVVEGNKLGRTIGFPTANVLPEPGIIVPGNGVYIATATLPDGRKLPTMVNIGTRPTVRRGNALTVEAHILDWKGDLYGQPIRLAFYKRLRDEIQFNSIDDLRRQLEKDARDVKVFFQSTLKSRK